MNSKLLAHLKKEFNISSVPDILADSHGSNDFLHRLFSLFLLLIVQLCLQFKDLPWKMNHSREMEIR